MQFQGYSVDGATVVSHRKRLQKTKTHSSTLKHTSVSQPQCGVCALRRSPQGYERRNLSCSRHDGSSGDTHVASVDDDGEAALVAAVDHWVDQLLSYQVHLRQQTMRGTGPVRCGDLVLSRLGTAPAERVLECSSYAPLPCRKVMSFP